MQARFLIPMICSLAFGVLFATVITLVFVPCLYLAGANLKARLGGQPLDDNNKSAGLAETNPS